MPNEEQQQEPTTPAGEPEMSERDALIAAVREAGGTASVDVDAEQAAAEARAKEATATPAPPAAEPQTEDRIASVMRLREKAHAEREAARQSGQQIEAEARERARQIEAEARERAKRIEEDEAASRRARFRANPVEALRNDYGDPEKVVDAVVRAGTPEARAQAKMEADLAAAQKDATEGKTARAELEKFRAELAAEKLASTHAQIRTDFLTEYAPSDKAPYMHARWEPHEVFDRCDALCREWQHDGLQIGKDFDQRDLVGYLEKQSKERFQKLTLPTPPAPQVGAGAPAREPGNAPKVSASPRTLSAAQGSERRTAPKPLSELSPEQARAALIEEVAAARKANPDSAF